MHTFKPPRQLPQHGALMRNPMVLDGQRPFCLAHARQQREELRERLRLGSRLVWRASEDDSCKEVEDDAVAGKVFMGYAQSLLEDKAAKTVAYDEQRPRIFAGSPLENLSQEKVAQRQKGFAREFPFSRREGVLKGQDSWLSQRLRQRCGQPHWRSESPLIRVSFRDAPDE
jgi:hypothetical protein